MIHELSPPVPAEDVLIPPGEFLMGSTEQEVPGYDVLDAGAGFTITEWLEISVLGRNLLDRAYLASSDEDAVLAPGRSVQLVLRGQL